MKYLYSILILLVVSSAFAWEGRAVKVLDGDTIDVMHNGKPERTIGRVIIDGVYSNTTCSKREYYCESCTETFLNGEEAIAVGYWACGRCNSRLELIGLSYK